ncbi:MAG: alpha/beta hydrolase [Chloroflexota bacterium]|nr:alpha/beta hydrolase [Chloroflexota bacterium]MDE2941635.1 alpha/beta hydrolase [Chloroflexota bacterium]MDE3267254.1 alpha/beta hydrolase [Chloroflexota bacterium]
MNILTDAARVAGMTVVLLFRLGKLLGWPRSAAVLGTVTAVAWLFAQRRRRRAASRPAPRPRAPAVKPSVRWTPARAAVTVAGALLLLAVGALHGITATAASSIPALAVLWLFTPAPLVFAARVARRWTRFRTLSTAYLAASAVLSVIVLAAVGWEGSERGLHPAPPDDLPLLEDYPNLAAALEEVEFPSADGTILSGWFISGTTPRTIALVHGFGEERHQMLPHADFLHDAGYSTLLFDLRSRGESEGEEVSFGYHESGDLQGAVQYIKQRPDTGGDSVGVLGLSMGGAAAIIAAADTPEIKAVVAESTFSSVDSAVASSFEHFIDLPAFPFAPVTVFILERRLGISSDDVVPADYVADISPRAVFIIHGRDDVTIVPEDGIALHEAAGEPKEPLWLIEGAAHSEGVDVAPDEYARRVLSFFDRHLPQ